MKAITLWQPWATLIAIGAKTIETRSWPAPPALIGDRIAIHAATKQPAFRRYGPYTCEPWYTNVNHTADCECDDGISPACARGSDTSWVLTGDPEGAATIDLPLGAIIATARLVDCVPMVEPKPLSEQTETRQVLQVNPDDGTFGHRLTLIDYAPGAGSITSDHDDQLPYGSYEPGRHARLLDDIEELNKPIGFRGRQRVWNWTP